MQTELCKKLGIEFPIFAFSHCRDVVAAVTNAGGFGVLGAVGFSTQQLAVELDWIDRQVGDRAYGIDVIIPNKYQGQQEKNPEKLKQMLIDAIPQSYRDFADKILDDLGIADIEDEGVDYNVLSMTEATSAPQIDLALQHPNVKLIANALGTPPADIIKKIQHSGRMVGALCGAPRHAEKHVDAGLDFIVAQGGEAGGHAGDIGSIVLWPDVVDIAGDIPVIAAGGIGCGRQMHAALSLGAQGVWCGSLWLTVVEAANSEAEIKTLLNAKATDTVRSRSFTGKHVRMIRNKWTDIWDCHDSPEALQAPLQTMLVRRSIARAKNAGDQGQAVFFSPAGQIVGRINQRVSCRDRVMSMVAEYLETSERMNALLPSDE